MFTREEQNEGSTHGLIFIHVLIRGIPFGVFPLFPASVLRNPLIRRKVYVLENKLVWSHVKADV